MERRRDVHGKIKAGADWVLSSRRDWRADGPERDGADSRNDAPGPAGGRHLRPRFALPLALITGLAGALGLGFWSGVRLNVSPSAPIGLYRPVDGPVTHGALVVACVPPVAASLARERGYLGAGACPGGVQPVLKRVGAMSGDTVTVGPDGVAVNGHPFPHSAVAAWDSRERPVPHAPSDARSTSTTSRWPVSRRLAISTAGLSLISFASISRFPALNFPGKVLADTEDGRTPDELRTVGTSVRSLWIRSGWLGR